MKKQFTILLVTALAIAACGKPVATPNDATIDAPIANTTAWAAVAMPDQHAAAAAEAALRAGGNAVDAAIAAGFVLAVTLPEAGNIGGGGFMLIRMDNEATFLDYREIAPMAADRDMYLDENGDVVPLDSLIGIRSVGVPGTVAGFWAAHERYGTLPWSQLVDPAIRLARDGFVFPTALINDIKELKKWLGSNSNFDEYFVDAKAGEIFKQPELAATLRRISQHGPADFYSGETAQLLIGQMQRDGGLVTLDDLARYNSVWREPLVSQWRDYELISSPPPSSGGFAIAQLLQMKDALAPQFEGLAHNSTQYVHLVAEMEKRVFADRAEYLGDPDFVDVRIDELITDEYTTMRALEVNPKDISALESAGPGLESPDTTHYSIVDPWGNAVSNTYSLNWSFGSGTVVDGAGFFLNNHMDDFSAKPGIANIYGVVGNVANEIAPGKRMLSSMAPTMLVKDGEVSMVVGTPGGSTIFTSVFQAVVNVLDFDMSVEQAVGAGRFHHQLVPPDLVTYSPSRPLNDSVIRELTSRGYRAQPHPWEFGDLQLIHRGDENWEAASDPRGRGHSRVFPIELPSSP